MMEALLTLGLFMISLLLGIPIAISLTFASIGAILVLHTVPLSFVVQSLFSASDSFPLMAVPFFILAGDIMIHGGISKRLVYFASSVCGSITGGLGIVTVFACMIFAAISGSGPATVAAVGGIMIPAMIEAGYDKRFSAALASVAGALGPIIPPSISFIIYGILANVSITELFIAGIIPGILLGISLMILTYFVAKKYNYGSEKEFSIKELLKAFNEAKWGLLVPIIILGGIYSGVFTPTESAIIACDYALIVGLFIYKEIKLKDIPKIFAASSLTSGTCLILVGCATVFARLLTIEQIPILIAQAILGISSNKIVVLLLINVFLFIVGMFIETLAAIIILAPLLLSIVKPLGISPLHFGLIMVVNLVIGMSTPPVGVNLFVASRIANIKIEETFYWLIPAICASLAVLMLITYIPQLSTFLPSLLRR